jgi:hypothetical protein
LEKTEQQLEEATEKLKKTEEQLEAAKEVDEEAEAEATKNGLFDELVKALATYTGVEAAVRPSCAAASFSMAVARARSLTLCLQQAVNIETFVREEGDNSTFKNILRRAISETTMHSASTKISVV